MKKINNITIIQKYLLRIVNIIILYTYTSIIYICITLLLIAKTKCQEKCTSLCTS